jgi:pSer/pThr/pTyr-binding forkhead associated (FHA) protein
MGSLFVSAGPNRGELYVFKGDETVIGRDPGCSFQLTDERISRRHIRIIVDHNENAPTGRHVLIDLGSANGTVVNGAKVAGPVLLKDGDQIDLGATVLRYSVKQLTSAPPFYSMQHIPSESEKFKRTAFTEGPPPKG